ncbi:ubiquinol-cytochrome c reductase iron-sulfur subunit [Tabrizicola sp.]|uniref:ubiquinol-cytochrome c reductase iron-sulfur subunit n=1 Tax=Tabrizicola sp. TaxID=2005166 RepID=UPI003F369750
MSDTEPTSRRSLLAIASAGAGAVAIGAAGWGLLGSLSPSADVSARNEGLEIKLSDIPEGTQITVSYFGQPVFIRHRTDEEIAAAESVALEDLLYSKTTDVAGRPIGTADDHVRRATADGKFIALVGIGSGFGCVLLGDGAGDFKGWFDPCRADHYDTSGRARKGIADQNLRLPVFELIDADTLRLLDPKTVSQSSLDDLLYR